MFCENCFLIPDYCCVNFYVDQFGACSNKKWLEHFSFIIYIMIEFNFINLYQLALFWILLLLQYYHIHINEQIWLEHSWRTEWKSDNWYQNTSVHGITVYCHMCLPLFYHKSCCKSSFSTTKGKCLMAIRDDLSTQVSGSLSTIRIGWYSEWMVGTGYL